MAIMWYQSGQKRIFFLNNDFKYNATNITNITGLETAFCQMLNFLLCAAQAGQKYHPEYDRYKCNG
jgi:hypothetical protein